MKIVSIKFYFFANQKKKHNSCQVIYSTINKIVRKFKLKDIKMSINFYKNYSMRTNCIQIE